MNQAGDARPATAVKRNGLMLRVCRVAAIGALLVSAAGCTTPYEGRYDFYEGWRKAEIVRIARFEELSPYEVPRCKSAPLARAAEGSAWAVVRYRAGRRSRQIAVPLPAAEDFKVKELVYARVSECDRDIRKRVEAP